DAAACFFYSADVHFFEFCVRSVSGHEDGDRLDVGCSSSLPQSQNVETEDEDADEGDVASNDDDWKPQPDLQSMAKRRQWHRPFVVEQSKTACKVCGVWYRMMGSLIKHAWSHLDESQGVCGVCGERSESVEELKKHLRKYQKTHDCSECGKSFSSVAGLTSHASLHTGSRRFKCDVCNKTFKYMSAHTKVHTGRERFHCHICGKSVYDLRSLTRHKATHSGERRPPGRRLWGRRRGGRKLSGPLPAQLSRCPQVSVGVRPFRQTFQHQLQPQQRPMQPQQCPAAGLRPPGEADHALL
uniref:C2H2-type domain-containing protein n=1 Tax=Echeneis naucrates TaxID=173247 RepID=A0A665U479_ECHNA